MLPEGVVFGRIRAALRRVAPFTRRLASGGGASLGCIHSF